MLIIDPDILKKTTFSQANLFIRGSKVWTPPKATLSPTKTPSTSRNDWIASLDLPVPKKYLEPVAPRRSPIYQGTIDPWFQIYRELEDDGKMILVVLLSIVFVDIMSFVPLIFSPIL